MKQMLRPSSPPLSYSGATAGFSLVELSVVLGLIALLIGGVLTGQHLYRAAQLNAAIKEYEYYAVATRNFRDKYDAYPGDMPNATRYFGRTPLADAFVASCLSYYPDDNRKDSGGTCNGGGDGRIGQSTITNALDNLVQRIFEANNWPQHLGISGFIEAQYSGLPGYYLNGGVMKADDNAIGGKIPNSIWVTLYTDSEEKVFRADKDRHHIILMGDRANLAVHNSYNPPLKPEEAQSIDQKIDDGKPALGKVVTYAGNSTYIPPGGSDPIGEVLPNCTVKADGTAPTTVLDTDAKYNLAYADKACILAFSGGF